MTKSMTRPSVKNIMSDRVELVATRVWVRVGDMKINPLAQRGARRPAIIKLAHEFDPELMGFLVISMRNGVPYIVDGQHRWEAFKIWNGPGWEDQKIECLVYEDLSEAQEAEMFLQLNTTVRVTAFDKFRIAIEAGQPEATIINEIVLKQGLRISRDNIEGAISAVTTLQNVYRRAGSSELGGLTLARTLRIIRDAYGNAGLDARVIDGLGMLVHRYNGDLDDERAITKLSAAHGGVHGLLGKSEHLRKATGNTRPHCTAAAAVEIINSGRSGKKLPPWWRRETTDE